ncbi:MAG: phosphoribosylglycinamide synthetase C domain-containing protein, partial [bacterium]
VVNGRTVTTGGRVVGVTALGKSVSQAIAQAYRAVQRVEFEGAHFRHDIGAKALKQSGQRIAR